MTASAKGTWQQVQDGHLPSRIRELAPGCSWVASVCTGAMVLAAAGLTSGRPATTHHCAHDDLRASGADLKDDRVVDDGDLITCGGVTSGLDMALWMVERELGPDLALTSARNGGHPQLVRIQDVGQWRLTGRPTSVALVTSRPAIGGRMAHAANATARTVADAREAFLTTGRVPGAVRDEVARSWQRSAALGVIERAMAPVELTDDALRTYRDNHPLAIAMPVVRELLVSHALDDELLVAVGDAQGRLLWVEGKAALRRQAESMHFVEGAQWDEAHAGTNAPGVATRNEPGVAHRRRRAFPAGGAEMELLRRPRPRSRGSADRCHRRDR